MNQQACRSRCDCESKVGCQLHITFEAFAGDLRRRGYDPNTMGLYGRVVAHFGRWLLQQHVAPRQIRPPPMSIGFCGSIYPDAIALHLWSEASPSVGERFITFGISCGESDGFPIHPNERPG